MSINTKIDIRDNNTQETGTYKVYYKDTTENAVDSLLNMRQKESFFMGKYTFTIESEYDFKKAFIF